MTKFINLLILLSVLTLCHRVSSMFEDTNPMYITLKKMAKCADMGKDSVFYSVTFKKVNETTNSVFLNATLPFEINNDITAAMVVMHKGPNGKYTRIMERTIKACEWKTMLSMMKSTLAEYFKCPVPKGVYQLNRPTDTFKINAPPIVPPGDYKVESSVYSHKGAEAVKETCYIVYLNIKRSHD